MYHGEVRICEQDIPRLLEAARFLEVRGLAAAQHSEKVHIFSFKQQICVNTKL